MAKPTVISRNLSPHDCDQVLEGISSHDPRIAATAPKPNRHAYASQLLVWDSACAWVSSEAAKRRAAEIVGGHHGIIAPLDYRLDRRAGADLLDVTGPHQDQLRAARTHIVEIVRETTGLSLTDTDYRVPAAAISLAVVVLADWLVSQREFLTSQGDRMWSGPYRPAAMV